MKDFGTRIKQARKNKKMTQKELAERLGVEQTSISNYETNFRLPASSALMAIAEQLGVSVEYLLGGEDQTHLSNLSEASNEVADFKQLQGDFFEHLLKKEYDKAFQLVRKSMSDETDILELYEKVFEPTLKAVGDLWESAKVSVAEEHIISDLIDRILVSLSENKQMSMSQKKHFSAAFMLPGAEMHQIPLKMTAEIFKNADWSINYIGKSIPLFSLQDFLQNCEIDILVLSVTLREHLNSCESLIRMIKEMPLEHRPLILVGGSAVENEKYALQILGADLYEDSLSSLKDRMKAFESKVNTLDVL